MSSKWTSRELTDRLFPSSDPAPFGRRLASTRGARIPIILVTGFLGAGKTTLIRKILKGPEGNRTAVIVNEFGEIGIDDALLRSIDERTVLLGNGCLCCARRSDLEETLAELLALAATGAGPGFDRVIIETSGLADPAPIISTFVADRGIGREFHLETVVTVADAPTIERNLAEMPEAGRQVAMADRVVLTKTDLVSVEAAEHLVDLLRAANPSAELHAGPIEDAALGQLLGPPAFPRSPFVATPETGDHSSGAHSFALFFDDPFEWSVFAQITDLLCDLRGRDLLRMKGLVAVRGRPGPLVVHAVQHVRHPPVELRAWPDADRRSRIVFIVRNLDRSAVEGLFSAVKSIAP